MAFGGIWWWRSLITWARQRSRYVWDLRFNDQKPLDLDVNFGAGESRLDLGDLTLRRVNVEMGVGELQDGSARHA